MSKKHICKSCGKEKKIYSNGYCSPCFQKLFEDGLIETDIPKCTVQGCRKLAIGNGYCSKHYHQIRRLGKILDNNPDRIYTDNNEIVIHDDKKYAEIILYNKDNYEKARAIIDLEDVDKIKNYKWNCEPNLHVYSGNTWLHRLIMNCTEESMVVDHINRNPLDNRKCNLRICTNQENGMNCSLGKDNTTGIVGLYYDNKKDLWRPNITVNQKVIGLGQFKNKDDAIKERLKAEVYYFGEFAPQRHLYKQYGIDENAEYEVKQYKPKKKGNKYGISGVFKGSGNNKDKWKVEFINNGKRVYLGFFNTLEEAIEVRQAYNG